MITIAGTRAAPQSTQAPVAVYACLLQTAQSHYTLVVGRLLRLPEHHIDNVVWYMPISDG